MSTGDDRTDELASYAAPQDTGAPDSVETDPAALNSAEDLDEDRLRADPLEAAMDPPERWSGADKYGTTPYEQAHPRPLDDRLAEEEPDTARDPVVAEEAAEAVQRGQSADEAGGSAGSAAREPGPAY
ncbi:MAG: hypothetical protein HOY78_31580 [Saccharothrix sp.]|nr:hypothetical protein [Saccharothrix sp.]